MRGSTCLIFAPVTSLKIRSKIDSKGARLDVRSLTSLTLAHATTLSHRERLSYVNALC